MFMAYPDKWSISGNQAERRACGDISLKEWR